MPKLRQYSAQYAQRDFLKEVDGRCGYAGLKTNEALGKAIGVTGRTVGNHREDPGKMQVCVLQKMVKVLKLDPGIVLQFLGYSSQEIRKFAKDYVQ